METTANCLRSLFFLEWVIKTIRNRRNNFMAEMGRMVLQKGKNNLARGARTRTGHCWRWDCQFTAGRKYRFHKRNPSSSLRASNGTFEWAFQPRTWESHFRSSVLEGAQFCPPPSQPTSSVSPLQPASLIPFRKHHPGLKPRWSDCFQIGEEAGIER